MLRFVFVIIAVFANQAYAGYGTVFGLGAESMSKGATAFSHNESSPFHAFSNPSYLAYDGVAQISFGVSWLDPNLKSFGALVINNQGTQAEFSDAGVLGGRGSLLALKIPIGKPKRPLTLGAAAYLSSESVSRVSGNPSDFPFYPMYQDISRNAFYSFSLAYRIWNGLAVGVGASTSLLTLADYTLRSDSAANFSATAVEVRSELRPNFSLSYNFEYNSNPMPLSVSFNFRDKTELKTKLLASVVSPISIAGELNSVPAFSPQSWSISASAKAWRQLNATVEVAYLLWSDYPRPFSSGSINFLTFGDGNANAGFDDVWVPKLGLEYKIDLGKKFLNELTPRFGYMYYSSPTPDQTGDSNFVDNDRHMITTGVGLGIDSPWAEPGNDSLIQVDGFFQFNLLVDRSVSKSNATNIGAPGYTSGGNILTYGLNITLGY